VFHSTPFQARPVVGPPEADDVNARLVSRVLQNIGMVSDDEGVPSPEYAQAVQAAKKRSNARVFGSEGKRVSKRTRK
jgi:hypothetical protein